MTKAIENNPKIPRKYHRKSNSSDVENTGMMWIVSPLILASKIKRDEEQVIIGY